MKKGFRFLCFCFAAIAALSTLLPVCAADEKFSMSYVYFGSSDRYGTLVEKTQHSLQEIAPNYFALDSNGGLTLTSAVSLDFVTAMHAQAISVVPYLTNDWDRQTGINALTNADALSDSLVAAIGEYQLDGVNIDIENVTPRGARKVCGFYPPAEK